MNTRRKFLQLAAANAILLEAAPPPQPVDRIRFGIIGIGMQGTNLLSTAISIPGAECVAAADLYDGRHLHAREITGNPSLPVTRRYQDVLARKDID